MLKGTRGRHSNIPYPTSDLRYWLEYNRKIREPKRRAKIEELRKLAEENDHALHKNEYPELTQEEIDAYCKDLEERAKSDIALFRKKAMKK